MVMDLCLPGHRIRKKFWWLFVGWNRNGVSNKLSTNE